MATKQKYLSAKWKLGTKSGKRRIIIIVIINNHDMQLVCCVVKKIRAFQKVSTVINIWENSLLFHCPFNRAYKNNFIPHPKKGHFYMSLVIFKKNIWSLRWDLKSSGRIAQNITTDWLLQTKQQVMIFRLQEDSGRREGYIEYPEMSLTTNHNSQVMKKYRWKRTNKSRVVKDRNS